MSKKRFERDLSDVWMSRWSRLIGLADKPNPFKFRYTHRWAGYHRHVRTTNELRQLRCDEAEGLPVRRRRLNIPTWYDDLHISRNYGKCWKDYTKRRKQWEDR